MSKYTVQYTTENPAYEAGRAMWRVVGIIVLVSAIMGMFA